MNVLILGPQVPYVRGGAEILMRSLRDKIAEAGHRVDIVTLPFRWTPKADLLKNCMAWRLINLDEMSGETIDCVISTKFPSYLIEHPRKRLWLVHQFREAYEYYTTRFSSFQNEVYDNEVRDALIRLDNVGIRKCERIYTISKNVSERLAKYNGIPSSPLYPPPHLGDRYRCDTFEDFVLVVGRLEWNKRTELVIEAMKHVPEPSSCVIVGEGSIRKKLEIFAIECGVEQRVRFAGEIGDDELLDLYASCGCVFYGPLDEDYGYVTIEAMKSRKPVITCTDSGGTLEFVRDAENGLVVPADPRTVGDAVKRLLGDKTYARGLGARGVDAVSGIGWDPVLTALLG
ncbi:MAG: glycosyltransferase family 4 protein [Acidobacteriota bacterium]